MKAVTLTHIVDGEESEIKTFDNRKDALRFLYESRKTDSNSSYWVL